MNTPGDVINKLASDTTPVAAVLLDSVRVTGFRSLAALDIPLEPKTTYLVGENNSGKSSLLAAIGTACGAWRPTTEDLHLSQASTTATRATIDLIIRSEGDEFTEAVTQRLGTNAGPGPGPGEWTGIRTVLQPTREGPFLAMTRMFLQWDRARGEWLETSTGVSEKVLELLSAQFLDASRDLLLDLAKKTSDWGRVLTDFGVSAEQRSELERDLEELASRILGASPIFGTLRHRLSGVVNAQAGVENVDVRALPAKLEDLARSVDVLVSSGGRAGLPLRYQGLGSRSLASLLVFHALCESRVGVDQGVRPHILILLEEPEAHLHPQAQVAVRRLLEELPGQVIVATHSNILLAEANPKAIRILRAANPGAVIHTLSAQTAKKVAVFRRYVQRPLGELFFARLVIFVDGTAERTSLPVMLESLLGRDPAGAGVSFIDMEGMRKEHLKKAIDALAELGGIPWICFVDNDPPGHAAIDGLMGRDGKPLSYSHDQVVMSGVQQLEGLLLDAGYHEEIRRVAEEHAPFGPGHPREGEPRLPPPNTPEADDEYLEFLCAQKSWAPEQVARLAVENEKPMPAPVIELAEKVNAELSIRPPDTAQPGRQ